MWSIRQCEGGWEVLGADGARFGDVVETYDAALSVIAAQLQIVPATGTDDDPDDGLLPERWVDAGGICFSRETGDGRDFTPCTWSSRDPESAFLPLMFQTETEYGHFGATLAGFIEEIHGLGASTTPGASGRFYDSDAGRAFRDMLLGGRRYSVSVDPGHVAAVWECMLEDEEGWCLEDKITFLEYEIIGLTGTPFSGFAEAAIQLEGGAADETVEPTEESDEMGVAAAVASVRSPLAIPTRPPSAWFNMPEPQQGQTGLLDVYGMPVEELLVEQRDGSLAVPLTILDDGRFFGHLARANQGHQGNQRVAVPESACAYAHYMVGEVVCADGSRMPTGALVAGCDHAALVYDDGSPVRAPEARDHYAHNGLGWGDCRIIEGQWGPWFCGALRPDVTDVQLRVLRASAPSGDWRRIGSALELITILSVNAPGFPIARSALTASGMDIPEVRTRGAIIDGEPMALVASGLVQRCSECQRRASEAAGGVAETEFSVGVRLHPESEALLREVSSMLGVLERRTRPLVPAARDALASRIRA